MFPLHQIRQRRLNAAVNALYIDVKHSVPIFVGDILKELLLGDARTANQRADRPQPQGGVPQHRVQRRAVAHVRPVGRRIAAALADARRDGFRFLHMA